MKVIIKRPGDSQMTINVDDLKLDTIYKLIGCSMIECYGYIELLERNNIDILLDEEGKLVDNPKPNILVKSKQSVVDILMGSILFVGVSGDEWVGLNDTQIKLINELLNKNNTYCILNGEIRKMNTVYL